MLDSVALGHPSSASQHDDYILCPRKWGFNKLDRAKRVQNRFAKRGEGVHTFLEDYLEGRPVDLNSDVGLMVQPGLKFVPAPKTALPERQFSFQTDTAVYTGKIDVSRFVLAKKFIHILDHKTTTDFKWLKDAEALKKNPQSIIYAVAGIALLLAEQPELLPEEIEVKLDWVYYRSNPKKPGARKVQLHVLPPENRAVIDTHVKPHHFSTMTHAELEEGFTKLEARTEEMLDHHRAGRKAKDLPFNLKGCNALGGCPYRGDPCRLDFKQIIGAHMANEKLIAKMRAAAGQAGTHEGSVNSVDQSNGASNGKPAAAPSTTKPSAAASAASKASGSAAAAQATPARVNAPEENLGKDPDAPGARGSKAPSTVAGGASDAAVVAAGIVQARIYLHTDPNYSDNVAALAKDIVESLRKG